VSNDATKAAPRGKKRGYHHGDLSRALVAAAVAIVERKGPEGLTLREAAAAVGVTHAAAYRHFEDKTALLAAIAEDGWRSLHQALTRTLMAKAREPREQVEALACSYVEFALARPSHYRVMMGPRLNADGRFPSLEAAIGDAWTFVTAAIERGQRTGCFRPKERPRDVAIGIWVAAHGYVELVLGRRLAVKSPRVAIEYFENLLQPYLDGLSPSMTQARKNA
jgi:AcrR family transcriptional regulator